MTGLVRFLALAGVGVALSLPSGPSLAAHDGLHALVVVTQLKSQVQREMKSYFDQRGTKYTPAQLSAAADDCFAKLAARGKSTTVTCGNRGAGLVVEIQVD